MNTSFCQIKWLVVSVLAFTQCDLIKKTNSLQVFLSKCGVFALLTLLFFSSHGDLLNVRQGEMDLVQFNSMQKSALANL